MGCIGLAGGPCYYSLGTGKHLQENALTLAVVVVKEKAHHGDLGRLLSEPVFEGLRGCGLVLGDFERA